jgi:PAT family beta-lactamase induction signal transducer AmpG
VITLDRHRPLRLATLCVLYAAQGMPDGFVRIALKNYLIDLGASVDAIGTVVAMVSWPWAMKWVWGPVIDRYGYAPMGRRRPWILLAQGLMAVTLTAMLLIPNLAVNIRLLALMVLLVNICASLQDVSVDALAVDLLPESERGAANGFMYASSYAGNYLGGRVLGYLLINFGLALTVGVQVAILAAMAAFPLLLRERPGDVLLPRRGAAAAHLASRRDMRPTSLGQVFRLLLRAFSLRATMLSAVLALAALIPVNGHLLFWPAHAQRSLGWTAEQWVELEGGWGSIVGFAGCIVGGLTASAFGAKRTVAASLAALAATWLAYAGTADQWTNRTVVTALFLAESALAGSLQVSMFALFMGVCWPAVAATQFTAYMALLNFSNAFGAKLAGPIESAFGIVNAHVALAVIQMGLVAVVWAIDSSETRRKLGDGLPLGDTGEIEALPPESPPLR